MVNKRFLVWTAAICAAVSIAAGTAVLNSVPAVAEQGDFSVEGIKVSNGSVSLENVTSDPYIYIDEASGGSLTNASESWIPKSSKVSSHCYSLQNIPIRRRTGSGIT